MQSQENSTKATTGQRTFVIVLDTDDEVMESLKRFVEREKLGRWQVQRHSALSVQPGLDILGLGTQVTTIQSTYPSSRLKWPPSSEISRPVLTVSHLFTSIVCWVVATAAPLPVTSLRR